MTLRGIITLVILAVLFALAVVWISRQGGWKGEGCNGNCASLPQPLRGPGTPKRNNPKQGCCTKNGAAALFYGCTPKTSANISGTLFTVVCSERTALGGVDSDGAQKVLQRLLVGGAADVQLL